MSDVAPIRAHANAWLLDFGQGVRGAVATRVLLQLVDDPKPFRVPCTPSYCSQGIFWQDRLLPVMDLAARLGAPAHATKLLAIACYQDHPGEAPRFGALALASTPVPVAVEDDAACALPEQPAAWSSLALSCFSFNGVPVPILHLSRIFSDAPGASRSTGDNSD